MKVKLPNGVILDNIPEGTSKEAIKAKAIATGKAKPEDFGDVPVKPSAKEKPGFGSRVVDDFSNYVGNFVNALSHPGDTAEALGNLAAGTLQMMAPDEPAPGYDKRQYPRAFGQYYANNYWPPSKAWESLSQRPVTSLADLSLPVSVGGGMLNLAGKAGNVPSMINAGKTIANVGKAMEPINATWNAAKLGPSTLLRTTMPKDFPVNIYLKGSKFSTVGGDVNRRAWAQALMDKGLKTTSKDFAKARMLIADLEKRMNAVTQSLGKSGHHPIQPLIKGLQGLRRKYDKPGFDREQNLAVIDDMIEKLRENTIATKGRDWLTTNELNQFKKDTYASINWKDPNATVANQAKLNSATIAKQIVAKNVPELDALNKEVGPLYSVAGKPSSPKISPMEQAAGRIGNLNLSSIGGPLKGMAGAGIGHVLGVHPLVGFAIGAGMAIADMPRVKMGLAIALNNMKKASPMQTMLKNSFLTYLAKQTGITDRTKLLEMARNEVKNFDVNAETALNQPTVEAK